MMPKFKSQPCSWARLVLTKYLLSLSCCSNSICPKWHHTISLSPNPNASHSTIKYRFDLGSLLSPESAVKFSEFYLSMCPFRPPSSRTPSHQHFTFLSAFAFFLGMALITSTILKNTGTKQNVLKFLNLLLEALHHPAPTSHLADLPQLLMSGPQRTFVEHASTFLLTVPPPGSFHSSHTWQPLLILPG